LIVSVIRFGSGHFEPALGKHQAQRSWHVRKRSRGNGIAIFAVTCNLVAIASFMDVIPGDLLILDEILVAAVPAM